MELLKVIELTKYFGGLCATSHLCFDLSKSEILGIIGPNGSGKTTLFNLITGVHKPDEGRIFFDGYNITGHRPHAVAQRGIARTFQVTNLFASQTSLDNVIMGFHCRTNAGVWGALTRNARTRGEEQTCREKAADILSFLSLTEVMDRQAALLSSAEQRRLMIGIAMATQPRLLLLDEPTAGMSSEETAQTVEIISNIRARGTAILLIEHNMQVAMNICDRFIAIEAGAMLAQGSPESIASNPRVIEAYLGKEQICSN